MELGCEWRDVSKPKGSSAPTEAETSKEMISPVSLCRPKGSSAPTETETRRRQCVRRAVDSAQNCRVSSRPKGSSAPTEAETLTHLLDRGAPLTTQRKLGAYRSRDRNSYPVEFQALDGPKAARRLQKPRQGEKTQAASHAAVAQRQLGAYRNRDFAMCPHMHIQRLSDAYKNRQHGADLVAHHFNSRRTFCTAKKIGNSFFAYLKTAFLIQDHFLS